MGKITTHLTMQDLIEFLDKNKPRSCRVNQATLGAIRSCRNGYGEYIWQPGAELRKQDTLFGAQLMVDTDVVDGEIEVAWCGDVPPFETTFHIDSTGFPWSESP